MKHYFRLGREDFRAAILKAMPKMLRMAGGNRCRNKPWPSSSDDDG